jgi:hypothetical protein
VRSRGGLPLLVTTLFASALACGGARDVATQAKQTAVDVGQRVTEPAMPCDKPVNAAAPISCVSGRIECGQTIESTTEGGESNWDDDFYAAKFCIPALDGHPGPERVYVLDAPAQAGVDVRLVSDCVDLDLIGVRFGYTGTCPGVGHAVPQCEGDDHRGGGRIHIETFDRSEQWLIGVDGKAGATGTFRLYVECDMTPR